MSDTTGNDFRRSSGSRDKKLKSPAKKGGSADPRSKSGNDVGRALRSVYDNTLGERVPDDFLDLLGKLS